MDGKGNLQILIKKDGDYEVINEDLNNLDSEILENIDDIIFKAWLALE